MSYMLGMFLYLPILPCSTQESVINCSVDILAINQYIFGDKGLFRVFVWWTAGSGY